MKRPFLRLLALRAGYQVYLGSVNNGVDAWQWSPATSVPSVTFSSAEFAWRALENVMNDKLEEAEKLTAMAAEIVRTTVEYRAGAIEREHVYGVILRENDKWWCVSFTALDGLPTKVFPLVDELTEGYALWLAHEMKLEQRPRTISDIHGGNMAPWSGEFGLVLLEDGKYAIDSHPWGTEAAPVELLASRTYIAAHSSPSALDARPVDQGERDTGDASDDAHGRPQGEK